MFCSFHGEAAKNSIKCFSRDSSTSDCSHDHKIKSSYLVLSSSPCKRGSFSVSQIPVSSSSSHSDDADHPNKVFVDDDEALFGAVPSPTEIQTALTSLKQ